MRASVASLSRKFISVFFAAALVFGLMPITAFAEPAPVAPATESSESADVDSDIQAEAEASAYENDPEENDGSDDSSQHVISSEGDEAPNFHVISSGASEADPSHVISTEGPEDPSGEISSPNDGDSGIALPAGDIINQEMELDTVVAQAESTRSFFLAQTLESTKTVPMVSAKLPIDTGANDAADAAVEDGASSSEGEGSDDPDGASESDDPVDPSFTLGSSEGDSAAVAAESTVIGSFTYLGMTFAIEPGGESVALMAVDYSKLPEEFVQKQVLVIPDTVTPEGIDYYSVTRIADDAFASLTKDNANPDYVGCEALFSDEELLAEAGIDSSEVQEFLPESATMDVAEEGESADADSQDMPKDEPWAYEDQDQATAEPAIISSVVDLNDGDASNHVISSDKDEASPTNVISSDKDEASPTNVISSGVSEANGVEKSRPSDEDGGEASADSGDDIRTIVSMEGNTATLNDGSTYEFTNPLAGCAGILTLGIPASVTTIEDDAFSGPTTLQYVVVSEDNSSFASYDGALYSADLANLRLIPGGRVGAVRVAPSATGADPEVFSHCPSVDALVADAEGEVRENLFTSIDWRGKTSPLLNLIMLSESSNNEGDVCTLSSDILSYGFLSKRCFVPNEDTGQNENIAVALDERSDYRASVYGCNVWISCDGKDFSSINGLSGLGQPLPSEPYTYICLTWHATYGGNLVFFSNKGDLSVPTGGIYLSGAGYVNMGDAYVKYSNNPNGPWHDLVSGRWMEVPSCPLYLWDGRSPSKTVTWNSSGASPSSSTSSVTSGSTVTAPSGSSFSLSGWTLEGWYTNTACTTGRVAPGSSTPAISSDTTYYAKWKRTVSFNTQGGSAVNAIMVYRTAASTTGSYTLPAAPSRSNWTFKGWATSSTGTSYTAAKASSTNSTATWYARWEMSVTLNTGGGTLANGVSSPIKVLNSGSSPYNNLQFSAGIPKRTNYTFNGWRVGSASGTRVDSNGTIAANKIGGNQTLYAAWTANTNTVTWNSSGASPASSTTTQSTGAQHMAPASGFTLSGWTLEGWYTNTACTAGRIAPGGKTGAISANTTYYAKWKRTITFNLQGGTGASTATAVRTAADTTGTFTTPVAPSRTGWAFLGWTTSPEGTAYTAANTATRSAATTWYARWKMALTLNADGGSISPLSHTALNAGASPFKNVAAINAGIPTRTGYTFDGWRRGSASEERVDSNGAIAAGSLDGNTTLYAAWTVNRYDITWDSAGGSNAPEADESVAYGTTVAMKDPGTKRGCIFAGWKASGADDGLYQMDDAFVMRDGAVTFTATWEDAPFSIAFTADDARYIKAIDIETSSDASVRDNMLLLKNDQLEKGVTVTGVQPNPDYFKPEYGFERFVAKGVDLTSLGWTRDGADSATSDPFQLTLANIATYFPDDATELTIYAEFHDEPYAPGGGDGSEVDPLTHWTAELDLDGGSLSADDAAAWTGNPPSVDFTHKSATIKLPTPIKTGMRFTGWMGSYDDPAHSGETPNPIQIAAGSVWDCTYTATWAPRTATVKFSYNAAKPDSDFIDVPQDPVTITYGKAMTSLGGAVVPTRPGYRFVGFFDTQASSGGQMYYTSELASSQSWNKDLADGAETTLYARWTKVKDPNNHHEAIADEGAKAQGVMSAVPHEGAPGAGTAMTVFDATYLGVYAWDSYDADATRPAASDAVTIDVSTYAYNSGFDLKKVPAQFDYPDADPAGPKHRLLGFYVGSGKNMSFVKFIDLLRQDAFQLSMLGNDLQLSGAGTLPPDFVVPSVSVEPAYTTGDPGYAIDPGTGEAIWPDPSRPEDPDDPSGSKPERGDIVVTFYDAGEGSFSGGKSLISTETTYVDDNTRPELPAEPARAGYEFMGWALSEEHQVGTAGCCHRTDLPAITSLAPRTFYAHWVSKTSEVVFQESAGVTYTDRNVRFGELLPALGAGVVPMPDASKYPGKAFKGYFDSQEAAGSVQYIDSAGRPVRPWDKTESPVYLYAQWADDTTGGSGGEGGAVTPGKPDPGSDPQPDDPFPGVPDDWKSVPTDPDDSARSRIEMPVSNATGSVRDMLYAGTYDGMMRFTDKGKAERPADPTDNVEVTIYSYAPDAAAADGRESTAHEMFEQVRKRFEDAAPAATPYLQGFRVASTGWPISLADLHEGRTVVVQCLGSDLEWASDGSDVRPASAVFREGAVVAVYSPTPVIDPGFGWPDDKGDASAVPPVSPTQVWNVFDANMGRFGSEGSTERVRTVASDYQGGLKLPAEPHYSVEGHVFDGWYLDGKKVDGSTQVTWTQGKTIYAHYRQVNFTISFAHDTDPSQAFEPLGKVWKGQDPANLRAEFQKRVPTRPGYEFVGWYAFANDDPTDAASAKPYYLVDSTNAWHADQLVTAVEADVTLYPYWSGRTYTITWRYNHGSFQLHDQQPFAQWTNVKYGDAIPAAFPVPDTPRFPFFGWYPTSMAAANATVDGGTDAIVGEGKHFQWSEERKAYVFAPPAELDRGSSVTLYAGWGKTPVAYQVKLHAGTGPEPTFGAAGIDVGERLVDIPFDESDPTATIDIYDSSFVPYMNLAGWKFTGWMRNTAEGEVPWPAGQEIALGSGSYEFTAQWAIAEEGAYSIEFLKGDEVTGGWSSPDAVSWYLEGDDEYLLLDAVTTRFDAGTEAVRVPRFSTTSTTGYDFVGWQRVKKETDEGGIAKWVDVEPSAEDGVTFVSLDADASELTGQQLVQLASAERDGTSSFTFRAVWEPKTFEVRYFMEETAADGTVAWQRMDDATMEEASWKDIPYDEMVLLPAPAFQGIGSIFERWGGKNGANGSSAKLDLVAGKSFTVHDLVMEVGKQNVEASIDGGCVLNLYAVTAAGMSFTVPLSVSIAFDLDDPYESMLPGEARIETTQAHPVRVESLQLQRLGTDESLELESGTDGSALVDLLVQGYGEADKSDLTDEGYLAMNLGPRNDGALYHAAQLADHGFSTFAKDDPLRLDYRLRFASGQPAVGDAFANLLDIRDRMQVDGTRASLPVAKLFYTVGLVQ